MAAMRFEQVQRFILAKKIFWGYVHFKLMLKSTVPLHVSLAVHHVLYTLSEAHGRENP